MSGAGDGFDVRSLAVTYPDGFRIGRHHHPWGQLVFATSGVMRVITDVAAWLVPPTRAIWLPPGLPHAIVIRGEVAMRTLYISVERGRDLPTRVAALEVAPLLRELVLYVLQTGMLTAEHPAHDRLAGLLVDLIAAARPQDLSLPLPRDRRALALAERLQARPDERAGLSALAGDAGASLRTLQRLFHSETGLSLDRWRQKVRMIHAVAALSAGGSVTAAALDSGYDSPSAFITAFKRQFGVTPGRYRAAA